MLLGSILLVYMTMSLLLSDLQLHGVSVKFSPSMSMYRSIWLSYLGCMVGHNHFPAPFLPLDRFTSTMWLNGRFVNKFVSF
ncbi:hypothetical protein F4777DRAFT_532752 [Nemania sp. FL0916]|nr:hypothetical protein F4777DRAFT_532752 [Nemania sp. FL0916]